MWDGNDGAGQKPVVYINIKRLKRKAAERAVKQVMKEIREREKREQIRVRQMPVQNMRHSKGR